jgi:hypothetical protein
MPQNVPNFSFLAGQLLTFAAFFWRFGDDLTAFAHKHLIPNDISSPWAKCGVSKWQHFAAS